MKPSVNSIQDIKGQVIELTWSYVIWWELSYKENRARFKEVLQTYPNYFEAVRRSMEQGFCVTAYRLFDMDGRVTSLLKLAQNLKNSDGVLAQQLTSRIDAHKTLLKKIQLIRQNVYGHRNEKLSPTDAYKKVKIKPTEMKTILLLVQETAAALAEAAGVQSKDSLLERFRHCESNAKDEAIHILQVLEGRNSTQ